MEREGTRSHDRGAKTGRRGETGRKWAKVRARAKGEKGVKGAAGGARGSTGWPNAAMGGIGRGRGRKRRVGKGHFLI